MFEFVTPDFLNHTTDSDAEVFGSFSRIIFITQFPIAVLAVACPCALGKYFKPSYKNTFGCSSGLATPTAVALATGCAAKFGILVRNVEVLELGAKKVGPLNSPF